MYLGFWIAGTTSLPILYELQSSWHSEETCDVVLRTYHIIRLSMLLFQLPLRTYMYVKLGQATTPRIRWVSVQKLVDLSQSVPWWLNQIAGVAMYVLFAAALLFAIFSPQCRSTEGGNLYHLLLLNLFLFAVQTLLTFHRLHTLIAQEGHPFSLCSMCVNLDVTQRMLYWLCVVCPSVS